MAPGLRALELRGDGDEDVFAGVGGDELHPDRHAVGSPVQREADGGLSGDVERPGEDDVSRAQALVALEVADRWGRLGGRGGEQQVVSVGPPLLYHAAIARRSRHRLDMVVGRDAPYPLETRPGGRFDVFCGGRTPQGVLEVTERGQRRAAGEEPERAPGADRVLLERGRMGFLDVVSELVEQACGRADGPRAVGVYGVALGVWSSSPIRSGAGSVSSSSR